MLYTKPVRRLIYRMASNYSYTVSPELWICKMKRALILFLIVSCQVSASQKTLSIEPLARANINCAAFYTAVQIIVKPEAKKEYESKMATHYSLSHQLSSSYELLVAALNSEAQRQAAEIMALKDRERVVNYISSNSIKCTAIEVNSIGVVRQNSVRQNISQEKSKL